MVIDDPLLGTSVGSYRLTRVLGEGGMGRVYLGEHPAIGSRVAIKVLAEWCARSPELVARFFAEARAVNVIRHEHIVAILDLANLPDGRPYIVMEFVDGQPLRDVLRAELPPIGAVVQLVGEMLAALAAAHTQGIVHRDIKPDNVMVTNGGHAKVLDFGIAKLAPGVGDASLRTQTGAVMGTPTYMAPEQVEGTKSIDARADLYAVGVVLFEALTGRVPFQDESAFALMRAHVEQPPPRPRDLRADLPASLESVVLTALAKDPAARFATAGAMAEALQHAAADVPPAEWRPMTGSRPALTGPLSAQRTPGARAAAARSTPEARTAIATPSQSPSPSPSPPPPPSPSPSRRRRSRLLLGAAVLMVSAVTAVTIALVARSGGSGPSTVAARAPSMSSRAAGSAVMAPTQDVTPTAAPPAPPPSAPATELTVPADYDPRRFDPVAYLPRALGLAQRLVPDAALTRFEFDPVFADGHVDLTIDGRDRAYDFRSPARSAWPDGRPKNLPLERPCRIVVELTTTQVSARVASSEDCDDRLVRAPRCTLAHVWRRAQTLAVSPDLVARIGWLFDEKWFFDTGLDGAGGQVKTIEDDCP